MASIKKVANEVAKTVSGIKKDEERDSRPLFNLTSLISGHTIGTIHAETPTQASIAGTELYGVPVVAW